MRILTFTLVRMNTDTQSLSGKKFNRDALIAKGQTNSYQFVSYANSQTEVGLFPAINNNNTKSLQG